MTSKNTLIAMTMIALGILLALVGYFSGGRWLIFKDADGLHVPSHTNLVSQSHELDTFISINIVNDYGDIEIIARDNDYRLETQVFEQQDVTYHIDNGVLTIETKAKKRDGFQFGFNNFSSPSIKLYVPKDTKVESVVIDSDFGDTAVRGLHYEELQLMQDYGDITFTNTTGDKTEITQSFGDLTLQQYASNGISIESEHGDITIDGTLNGQSTISSSFGDMTLHLQNKQSDLGYDLKTSFGDITMDGEEQSGKVTQVNNGDHQLHVSLSHGDLDVSLK
ncbi:MULTISPECIES: DUF4097 family beta strand repeat-containing protein [Lysinibacillus]|uniref:DUF4097 domain-containing protein n=1 Tax=Lysinibacillus fusiformis TaxID=28031 RepID=A0A2I0V3I7_9BACI|nr:MULTISPECIES: DUF4097 family beta strand repeat-containing protein [Lysinibacillus]KUF33185.1 hypothetical protein AK833_11585 [Lysinibacillus sp. F5]PKU52867.1 hypothetical protein CRI88_00630 [Lysinibacillus fusiformis]SCY62492.1 Putative adhesin [Lysinibacillus sp. SG9]SDB26028.1 Putative adhesin [Lysinibacillus sp. TC-37]SFS84312.1 Putative adhesin [Lysinibacillus sp. SG55]